MTKIDRNSPVGLRLAYRFWIELGRPARYHNQKTMEAWAPKIESLFRQSGLDYMAFRWFLIWALRLAEPDGAKYGNDFTARNLRSAHDPMASLVKQFGVTFFDIFSPKADKIVPLLVAQREREEDEARLAAAATQPTRWVDILPANAPPWEIQKARFMDAQYAWDAAHPCGPVGRRNRGRVGHARDTDLCAIQTGSARAAPTASAWTASEPERMRVVRRLLRGISVGSAKMKTSNGCVVRSPVKAALTKEWDMTVVCPLLS